MLHICNNCKTYSLKCIRSIPSEDADVIHALEYPRVSTWKCKKCGSMYQLVTTGKLRTIKSTSYKKNVIDKVIDKLSPKI